MIITGIVSLYAEESALLWLVRSNAIRQPHYSLTDISKLDDRVEAHLDGLRIAGEDGWELCKSVLGDKQNGEVFAASVMAFESGNEPRIQAVLDVVEKNTALSKGMISALGWIPFQQITPHIQSLLSAASPVQKLAGLGACAIHRQDVGAVLADALTSSDAILKARALKGAGELGKKNLLRFVQDNLQNDNASCRFWAGWSGALLGQPEAISVLQRIAEGGGVRAEQACAMALRRMSIQDAYMWQKRLTSQAETLRLAVQAVGVVGDPIGIPWLIDRMAVPDVARVAGEAFEMITGVHLSYDKLEGEKPEGFEAGPTENPEDENVEMDPDEDLYWPSQELIQKWWSQNKGRFTNGTRYLCGQPMTIESLNQVLRTGRQRQRAGASIELAMRQPGTPLFNTSAPGFRQQALLGLK